MELRTHAHILKNARWFLLITTVLVGLAAFIFAFLRPVSYKAVVSFDVNLVNRPATVDYQYGTYYDLKAAELYTQHLMSLMITPAIVEEVYRTAGVGYTIDSIERFTHRFQTKQYSAQNFVVTFNDTNRENAEKLSKGISEVVEKRAVEAVNINDQAAFSVNAEPAVIAEANYNVWMVTVVGIIAGFLLGVILVYLREYFRN